MKNQTNALALVALYHIPSRAYVLTRFTKMTYVSSSKTVYFEVPHIPSRCLVASSSRHGRLNVKSLADHQSFVERD
jgi:hypothetical protein